MKYILFLFIFYLPFNLLSQTTKVKNDDIINLREQIKELKIENSLLIEKIGELNLKFSQIEKTLLNNQIELTNSIERVQKSILFLGVDISSLIKGDIKNLPGNYNNSNNNITKPLTEEKTKKVEYSGQCKANTKKGTRCSRSAGSNGYCWQHGG
jgi:hypothetical protein